MINTHDVDYYLSLITSQHADKPKFRAMVAASVKPFCDIQACAANLINDFDLDQAQGVQLDAIGLWVGISRRIAVPLTGIYFTYDDPPGSKTGYDNAIYKEVGDPSTGLTVLPDSLYLPLIRAKIVANYSRGTTDDIYDILDVFTMEPGSVLITNNQDMTITLTIDSTRLSNAQIQIITTGTIPIKPAGVGINYIIV